MQKTKPLRIGDALVELGLITDDDVKRALEVQKKTGERLGTVLMKSGAISETDLLEALSGLTQSPVWDLEACPPTEEALNLVPPETCFNLRAVPVHLYDGDLLVAMRDIDDVVASDKIASITKKRVKPVLVRQLQLENYLNKLLDENTDVVGDLVTLALEVVGERQAEQQNENVLTAEETAPVISLVNQIIADAISLCASDVHIEPRSDRVDVRYRLDGLLHEVKTFPIKLHPMVVARIKIMAELDIVESRLPQDGSFSARIADRSVDIRVSTLPSKHGSRIVFRILDGSNMHLHLDRLGFAQSNLEMFRGLLKNPYGLVLVTGPTGSGKTTTLYSALNELKSKSRNIMTCEDPIECDLDGINQSQVFERIGLTFAAQLRAILRQDPDIVLVGEVRDNETLQTAIRASLTGHLVLSTLHCNDAVGALPRIFDMGGEAYLLSTSLVGVVSQRLLRRACPACRHQTDPTSLEVDVFHKFLGRAPKASWHSVGCQQCSQIGFKGRVGVHEILKVNPEISTQIARRATVEEITVSAQLEGMTSIQSDALLKAEEGVTTLDEAMRLVSFGLHGVASEQRLAA